MSNQTVDFATMQRFAPKVYLHPYERHLPTSVENYFSLVNLKNASGATLSPTVNSDILLEHNDASFYMTYASQNWPTAANDFATGDSLTPGRNNIGICTAPMYGKTRSIGPNSIDIVYSFFYAFNGFQTFRIGVGVPTHGHNMEWARFARHEADWEHVTVRISSDQQRVICVFYGQHGGSAQINSPTFVDGTHPVVYSAWNSHASYPDAAVHTLDSILGAPGVQPIGWFKAADITINDDIHAYTTPAPLFSSIEWTPWVASGGLVDMDSDPEANKWLNFLGRFGMPKLDNTHIDSPPSLPSGAGGELMLLAKSAKLINKLPNKYLYGDGPASPLQQGWWAQHEI